MDEVRYTTTPLAFLPEELEIIYRDLKRHMNSDNIEIIEKLERFLDKFNHTHTVDD